MFINNDFIDKLFEVMINNGVNLDSMIIVEEENTPTCFVMTDDNKDQISYFYWGAGKEFASSKVPLEAIQNEVDSCAEQILQIQGHLQRYLKIQIIL